MPDPASKSPSAVDRENPWPGLESFTEEASAFFFGREKETDELWRLVRRQTLTVLFGQSGLGKSSLLQAGLFPLLRANDHLPLYLRLDHAPVAPALVEQVKSALNAAFAAARAEAPAFAAGETLWEYFHRKDVDIWSAKNRLLTPVLAFDQFEEIFTLGRADEACRQRSREFLGELACLVENHPPAAVQVRLDAGQLDPARFNFEKPSCRVILSLREDFLPDLEGLKQDLPALIHNRLRLRRLNGAQALEIVSKPAPHLLADAVPERIVEFVAGARGGSPERLAELDVEPPLLSVICRELNERRRVLGHAQITADLVTGNRREILHDFYERSVADLPEPMRRFVEDKLLTKSGFRDNLALETALEEPGVTKPLIDTLVQRRLLRIEDRIGTQRVELTHDVLADVIRASRDARQARLALEQAEARERTALAEAARRTRRLRWLVAGLTAVVVALCAAGGYGLRQRQQALTNASRTDAAFASRLLEAGNTAEGLAYYVRAAREDPRNPAIGPRLISGLVSRNFLLPQGAPLLLPAPVVSADFSSGGQDVCVLSEDGIVRLVDARERRVMREFRLPSKIDRIFFPYENDRAFVADFADQTLQTCDAATGKPVSPLMRNPERFAGGLAQRVFLSADGHWLAALSESKVYVWDATNGRALSTLDLGNRTPIGAAFSPDGTRVLTCAAGGAVRQWSTAEGSPLLDEIRAPLENSILGVKAAYSRDGRRFAVGWQTGGAQLFDTATNRPIGPVLKQDVISQMGFSSDGRRLFTLGSDGAITSVHTWDASTGAELARPWSITTRVVSGLASRNGRDAATVDSDGAVRVWDFTSGRLLAEPTPAVGGSVRLALSPDGTNLLVAAGTALHFFHLGAGAARPLVLHRGALNLPILFLPGKPTRVLWPGTRDAKVLDVASGRESAGGFVFPKPILPIGAGTALRGDGGALVAALQGPSGGSDPAGWEAWMINGGAVTHTAALAGVPPAPGWVRFSPTGNLAAIVSSTSPDAIRVWNLETGQPVAPAVNFGSRIFHANAVPASFSPDGRLLVAGTVGGLARVWDIATGRTLFDLGPQDGRVARTAFSPDGSRLAIVTVTSSGSSILRLWEAPSGRLVHEPVTLDGNAGVSFSEDGRRMITWNWRETRVWDARTGEAMGEPITAFARSAQFSHDGRRLATAGNDSEARVWDARTSQPVTEPLPHPGVRVPGAEFSPDDRLLRTDTSDDRYLFWSIPPPAGNAPVPDWLLDLTTLCIGRRLTDEGRLENADNQAVDVSAIRRTLAALPDDAPYVEWGRWFLADRATRSIAPGFTITPAEADQLAREFAPPPAPAALPPPSSPRR